MNLVQIRQLCLIFFGSLLAGCATDPHFAVEKKDHAEVRALFQKNPIHRNYYGYYKHTPLYHAVVNNDLAMVKTTVEGGGDVNFKGWGRLVYDAPLFAAAQNNNIEIMKYLLAHGANVNLPSGEGFTALHIAVADGRVEATETLLAAGADVNLRNKFGNTAICQLFESKSRPIAELLIARGAAVDVVDNDKVPLVLKMFYGVTAEPDLEKVHEIVRHLLDRGAPSSLGSVKFETSPSAYALAERFFSQYYASKGDEALAASFKRSSITSLRKCEEMEAAFRAQLQSQLDGRVATNVGRALSSAISAGVVAGLTGGLVNSVPNPQYVSKEKLTADIAASEKRLTLFRALLAAAPSS